MGVSSRGLFGILGRLRPPPADSDTDLLERFVRAADQSAFTGLVRRHGAMVLSVCRHRLGSDADAEDAFQAVFLALATSAGSIRRRESLAGWLYRVAHQIARKAAVRRARRTVVPLASACEVPGPDPLPPAWEADELRTVIDAEVADLPDKFRAVVVLCLIEGRTNAEAAAVLAVPVGTVDSRLSTARKQLQARLTRRGVVAGAGGALGQVLGGPLVAAGPRLSELAFHTASAALVGTSPGSGTASLEVIELARGVTMTTTNIRALVTLGLVLVSAGAGLYIATAADPVAPLTKAGDHTAPPENVAPPVTKLPAPDANGRGEAALLKPVGPGLDPKGAMVADVLKRVEDETGLIVRVDVAAFRQLMMGEDHAIEPIIQRFYESKIKLPRLVEKMPLRDAVADALAHIQFMVPCRYVIRGNQLVIVPGYTPAIRPGFDPINRSPEEQDDVSPFLTERVTSEQIYGAIVSLSADHKPLAEILIDLRKQSSANIVLDPRCEEQGKKPGLTVTLSDVRLYDALRVIADMAELKMVYAGNIYYVTTPANAKAFQSPARVAPQSPPKP